MRARERIHVLRNTALNLRLGLSKWPQFSCLLLGALGARSILRHPDKTYNSPSSRSLLP